MNLAASRFISGLISGLVGTIIFSAILTISLRIFSQEVFSQIPTRHYPAIMIAVFFSTIISNLLLDILYYYFEKEKYSKIGRIMLYTVIAHIFVQLLTVPMYFSFAINNMNNLFTTILVQIVFSLLLSQMSLELLSKYKNPLTFSFGIILSTLASLVVILFLSSLGGIFVIMLFPIVLLCSVSLLSGFLEGISLNENSLPVQTNKQENQKPKKINLYHDYSKDDN